MNSWWKANRWAGYAVFGFPAVLAVPAITTTVARFGPVDTLASATLPVLWILTPLMLWVRYTRHRPSTRRGAAAWIGVTVFVVGLLLASPIWFWSGLALLVLASEAARAVVCDGTQSCVAAPRLAALAFVGAVGYLWRAGRTGPSPVRRPGRPGGHHLPCPPGRSVTNPDPPPTVPLSRAPETLLARQRRAIAHLTSALVLDREGQPAAAEALRNEAALLNEVPT